MSVFLITSSFVTTLLIPAEEFEPGGEANGRALAYLAHELPRRRLRHRLRRLHDRDPLVRRRLGDGRAAQPGAALPAALRHGARVGRAPSGRWCSCFTAIAFLITWIFDADVDAQGGAYATGVLVLITSAAVAVTLAARRRRRSASTRSAFARDHRRSSSTPRSPTSSSGRTASRSPPASSLASSLVSLRLAARPRLRAPGAPACVLDEHGQRVRPRLRAAARSASSPTSRTTGSIEEYARARIEQIRADNDLPPRPDVIFVEVTVTDPSDFEAELDVRGVVLHGRYRVLDAASPRRSRTPSPPCCCTSATSPASPRTSTSSGPRATRVTNFLRFLLLRRGRGRPGHPRGPAPSRARPGAAAAGPRRLMAGVGSLARPSPAVLGLAARGGRYGRADRPSCCPSTAAPGRRSRRCCSSRSPWLRPGGRPRAGAGASVLGVLSLNFWFTEPVHTLDVATASAC